MGFMLVIGKKSSSKEKELNQKTKKLMRKRIMMTTPARGVWKRISATATDTYVSVEASVSVEAWLSVEAWVSVETWVSVVTWK